VDWERHLALKAIVTPPVAPPRSRGSGSQSPSPDPGSNPNNGRASASELLTAVAPKPCDRRAHLGKTPTWKQHALSQEKKLEGQEDTGESSDHRGDAVRPEVDNQMCAGGRPVHSMGWENIFDRPEVDSLEREHNFSPHEIGSLGWESMFEARDASTVG